MSLSPRGIREHLKLNRPIYARTAAYGHFGRKPEKDGGFSWEKPDLVKDLKSAFNVRYVSDDAPAAASPGVRWPRLLSADRKSVVYGERVSVSVDVGERRLLKT